MTATETLTATKLNAEQLEIIARKRRDLATAADDARDDRSRIQSKFHALGSSLEDKNVLQHIQHLQSQLERSTAAFAKAEAALGTFEKQNPSEEELSRRVGVIAEQKAKAARDQARKPFLANRANAIKLLAELVTADAEAKAMIDTLPFGTFTNPAEATDLSDLLLNWTKYNRDADGLAYLNRALKSL